MLRRKIFEISKEHRNGPSHFLVVGKTECFEINFVPFLESTPPFLDVDVSLNIRCVVEVTRFVSIVFEDAEIKTEKFELRMALLKHRRERLVFSVRYAARHFSDGREQR